MVVFQKIILRCYQASLHKRGVGGGSFANTPSHGEWRGFKKTQISIRQHYLTTTVLTAVIVIFIFMCIFITIISMCM